MTCEHLFLISSTLQQIVCIKSSQIKLLYPGFDSVFFFYFIDLVHEKQI